MADTYDDVNLESEYSWITRDPDTFEVIKEEKYKSANVFRHYKSDKDGKVKAPEIKKITPSKIDTIITEPNAELKAAALEAKKKPSKTEEEV